MSHGLQRPQEPPWPGSWGLGAIPSWGRTTPSGALLLTLPLSCAGPPSSPRGPPRRPQVPERGAARPQCPSRSWLRSHREDRTSGPGPSLGAPAPPHRLVEGLHHGLGVVGVVVHDGLLQGLVIELLHVLGDLRKEVLTAQRDCPPPDMPSPGSLGRSGRTCLPRAGRGLCVSLGHHSPSSRKPCGFLPKDPAQRSAHRPSPPHSLRPCPPHQHPCPPPGHGSPGPC